MNTENAGRRIRLVYMRGDEKIQSGDEGTVKYEDDMGQIHVQWDNGSTLAIIPEVDEFEWIGESIKKFSDFIVEKKSDSVVLKSKSDKGNRLFNQLKTRLFQHYDMPKGELSTIYGGEEKRKKIVSKLSKEDKKTYREWLKTPEGQKSLELWNDGDNKQIVESKVISKFGDELEVDPNWPGLNIPINDYKTKVKDSLVDIIMNYEGVSEKDFKKIDEIVNKVKEVCKDFNIKGLIEDHELCGSTVNYVAEIIYNEKYKMNEDKDQITFGLDKSPSNIHSRQSQNFYDYHTRQRVTGKSKYELSSELFDLSQREDEIGTLAQYCLQITRESIVSDDTINSRLSEIEKALTNLGAMTSDLSNDQDEIEDKLKDINPDVIKKLGEDF